MKKLSFLVVVALLNLFNYTFAGTWEVLCIKQGPVRGQNLPLRELIPTATHPPSWLSPSPQNGYPIPSRSLPTKANIAEQSDVTGQINFIALGMGGQITMRYDCWIINGPGLDFTVYETTWGNPACSFNVTETALVEVSEDGFNWMTPGSTITGAGGTYNACQNQSFDIAPMMKVQYVRITDRTNPTQVIPGNGHGNSNGNGNGRDSDGYDLDGISTNYEMSPVLFSASLASSVICDYQQGVASQYVNSTGNFPGRGIVGVRKNFSNANINEVGFPSAALTNPSLRDGSNQYNFWSMGFGGWACMQLPYTVFNGPGPDFYVFETTWQNQPCPSYPEKALVSVSADGTNWSTTVLICKDALSISGTSDAIDLSSFGPAFSMVNYIKFQDATNPSNFGGGADGFDIDNIYIAQSAPTPPGQTRQGSMCGTVVSDARRAIPNTAEMTFIDGGVPEEMFPLEIVGSNVVSDKVRFMATIAEEGGYNYTVHNSLGMAISKGQLLGNTYESPEMEIDLNGFNNGVYFLTLTSKSTKETVKFLKN
jgi:hypothetical protein